MAKEIKTIGILTSGGDAQGMNAAIRAAARSAMNRGVSVKGIMQGYSGLLKNEIVDLNAVSVGNIIHHFIRRAALSLSIPILKKLMRQSVRQPT